MTDIISPLRAKLQAIRKRKGNLKREYEARIADLDTEEKRVLDAIESVNAFVKDAVCPYCNGEGEIRLCGIAGSMKIITCSACGGTGIAGRCRMNISEDSKALLELYRRQYPGVAYVTRSRGDSVRNPGALRLHWTMPEVTDGGFAPTGRFVELAPELLPEVPEGVMMKIDTLLTQDVTARRAEDLPCEEVAE